MGREAMTKTLIGHDMALDTEGGDKDYAEALDKQAKTYIEYLTRVWRQYENTPNDRNVFRFIEIINKMVDSLEMLSSYLHRHQSLGKNYYDTMHNGGESLPFARRGIIDLNISSNELPKVRPDTLERLGMKQHAPQIMRIYNWIVTVFDRLRSLWQMNSTGDQFDKINGPAKSRDDKHWADFGHTASLAHLGTHKTI